MSVHKLSGNLVLVGTGAGSGVIGPTIDKRQVNSADGTVQNVGIKLPANAGVYEVMLNVRVAEVTGTTKTLNLGTTTDPDGYAVGLSVAAVGLFRPSAAITVGASETFFASTTRGALLANFTAGADVATDVGTNYEFADVSSGSEQVVYQAASGDWAEFQGDVYVVYGTLY